MPKKVPEAISDRVLVLLRDEKVSATEAQRAVAVEFEGYKVSLPWVTGLAEANDIPLQRGRPAGAKDGEKREPRSDRDDALRAEVRRLYKKHKSMRKVGALVGRSAERVRQLLDGQEK